MYREHGEAYLETYRVPLLNWEEVKALKGPGTVGLPLGSEGGWVGGWAGGRMRGLCSARGGGGMLAGAWGSGVEGRGCSRPELVPRPEAHVLPGIVLGRGLQGN